MAKYSTGLNNLLNTLNASHQALRENGGTDHFNTNEQGLLNDIRIVLSQPQLSALDNKEHELLIQVAFMAQRFKDDPKLKENDKLTEIYDKLNEHLKCKPENATHKELSELFANENERRHLEEFFRRKKAFATFVEQANAKEILENYVNAVEQKWLENRKMGMSEKEAFEEALSSATKAFIPILDSKGGQIPYQGAVAFFAYSCCLLFKQTAKLQVFSICKKHYPSALKNLELSVDPQKQSRLLGQNQPEDALKSQMSMPQMHKPVQV